MGPFEIVSLGKPSVGSGQMRPLVADVSRSQRRRVSANRKFATSQLAFNWRICIALKLEPFPSFAKLFLPTSSLAGARNRCPLGAKVANLSAAIETVLVGSDAKGGRRSEEEAGRPPVLGPRQRPRPHRPKTRVVNRQLDPEPFKSPADQFVGRPAES